MLDNFEKYPLYTEGGRLYKKQNASKEEFLAAISYFEEKGYEKKCENAFGGALFCTLTSGSETVNVTYKKKSSVLRVIVEKGTNLPLCEPSEPVCDTLVTQVKTTFWSADCGMSYIVRLGDGTFCVIDGGMAEEDEAEHLISLLQEQSIADEKPHIRAWFITHPHNDHYNLFLKIAEKYKDEVTIENLIYNWPHEDYSDHQSPTFREVDRIGSERGDINVIVGRTGYKFELCDNIFEIILSPEDIIPRVPVNVNDTSVVIRQTTGKKRIMYLADALTIAADIMMEEYEADALKAEIMQVAHHGYWGGSDALYRAIDPEILLWPLPEFWYYRMRDLDHNKFLVTSENIKNIFCSNRGDVTLNMSSGAVIYNENTALCADFGKKSMTHLGWECVTGGSTGYKGAQAEFTQSGLRLLAEGEKMSVVTIIKPYLLQGKNSYTFELNMDILSAQKLGLVCNYDTAYIYDESKVIDLCPQSGKAEYVLCADEKCKKITLTKKGEVIYEGEYTPDVRHGIYLIMKDAEVEIKKVEIK